MTTTPGNYSWKFLECNLPPGKCKHTWKPPGSQFFEIQLACNSLKIQRIEAESLCYSAKCHFPAIFESKLLKKFLGASPQFLYLF